MCNTGNSGAEVNMKSLVGKTLRDSYLLEKYLAEGNFGAVYKSQQQFLGVTVRRVAVKISKTTDVDVATARDIFADAFMLAEAMDEMSDAEARTYLVHVYDLGILKDLNNRMFVVMEFIQGTDLAAQFRAYNRVPANLLLKWGQQICMAVKGLHNLVPPVLHRDLKPDNILLGIDRSVRVVDFGLAAKMMAHGYVPGVAGTTAYMAPETMKGESVPASDVYSIGIILYEGLTGRHPFHHLVPPINLPAGLYNDWLYDQKSRVQPEPPSRLNNMVSPELEAAVMRCLAFNPAKRYPTAGELLDGLNTEKHGESAGVTALKEGQGLSALNDLTGARRILEEGLSIASNSKETRFFLLRELGAVLDRLGEHALAANHFVNAWELARNTAVLRTRRERADLLKQIIESYQRGGNTFQATRYEKLRKKELQM